MIPDMPRPRPPHLHREITRHGTPVWYVRVGKGPRIRIRVEFGTKDFEEAYQSALRGEAAPKKGKLAAGTLGWLIDRYRNESIGWKALSLATRRQRENIFKHILANAGSEPFARIDHKAIVAGRDRRRDTPNAARHFVQTMRGLFKWAIETEIVDRDPTQGVTTPRPRTEGYTPWDDDWCAAYEARWPLGTRERVWYEVIHCTGLRRGDAVRVGRQHVKNGRGMIRTQKNDETAYFLISDRLQEALDAGPTGDMHFIVGVTGQPLTKESFGNYFREACKAAGVAGSAHGIRKTRAIIEAENGASGARLDALLGWRTGSNTSAIYIKKANRARLAFGADAEPKANILFPHPESGAGAGSKKATGSK